MSAARDEILGRIRSALRDVPADEQPAGVVVPRTYRTHGDLRGGELIDRFAERVRDYNAEVRRIAADDLADAVAQACDDMQLRTLVVPQGLPAPWRPLRIEVTEDHELGGPELDEIDGALTGCALAIAETGTLVLDGGARSGRRATTLIPDNHICIVEADQIVESVPEAVRDLAPAARDHRRPITLVSGPSASSDIELSRVEGVHGPRHLLVLVLG